MELYCFCPIVEQTTRKEERKSTFLSGRVVMQSTYYMRTYKANIRLLGGENIGLVLVMRNLISISARRAAVAAAAPAAPAPRSPGSATARAGTATAAAAAVVETVAVGRSSGVTGPPLESPSIGTDTTGGTDRAGRRGQTASRLEGEEEEEGDMRDGGDGADTIQGP